MTYGRNKLDRHKRLSLFCDNPNLSEKLSQALAHAFPATKFHLEDGLSQSPAIKAIASCPVKGAFLPSAFAAKQGAGIQNECRGERQAATRASRPCPGLKTVPALRA
jgi:hypothetical protein